MGGEKEDTWYVKRKGMRGKDAEEREGRVKGVRGVCERGGT